MKIPALSLTVIILATLLIFSSLGKTSSQELAFKVMYENSEAKIFVEGKDVNDITVLEINLEIDPLTASLVQADLGGFLGDNPLKVNWEMENKRFILIKNPQFLNARNNLNEPAIILKLNSAKITSVDGKAYLKGEKSQDLKLKNE